MHRLFLALNLEDTTKKLLAEYARSIRPVFGPCRLSWVSPEIYHLTLYFFGEVDDAALVSIAAAFVGIEGKCAAPLLSSQGAIFLPNRRNPRTCCVGFSAEPQGSIDLIVEAARRAAKPAGLPVDNRPWAPHLSLARIKSAPCGFSVELPPAQPLAFMPCSFDLMESVLLPGGPRYSIVRKYAFADRES
ncbi:MAG: RNA 2',3'-cyclic phosphodiesterase [Spirochaetaceae bacterium]|nr:RNA 2',3'-cyclic phosphodiesterase [Spirochaetaceae bacterium]